MHNIHQSFRCGVIPPHILRNVAERAEAGAASSARETLQQMQQLGATRERRLLAAVPPPAPAGRRRRNVYDARHGRSLPGKLVMSEGRKRGSDVEVNEAFDGSGATHDFYSRVFGRDSVDGRGMRLDSTVHYGANFDNALWNGRQMVYGDGDGTLFTRFTIALDVIGHELTHGVTQYTAGLGYDGQNGALNEHVSDAFGIMVKQRALGLTARQSDWLIGAGIFAPGVKGKAIRSMAAPGTAYDDPVLGRDPQPAHMRDYVQTSDDNGGVHINSGILNHALYLAAVGLGGETWGALGAIWYATLTTKLPPRADFQQFANATTAMAAALYGAGSSPHLALRAAWSEVGLPPAAFIPIPKGLPPTPAPAIIAGLKRASDGRKENDRANRH
jgi:Zn-dependent metalloprotease